MTARCALPRRRLRRPGGTGGTGGRDDRRPAPAGPARPTGGKTGGKTPPPSRSTIPTRKGSAILRRAKTKSPVACNAGFTATVRGREIKRVVFTLDGKRLANLSRSPFRVHIPAAFAASGHIKARVTFKDATRAKMLNLRYRACAAAVVRPRPRPRRSPDDTFEFNHRSEVPRLTPRDFRHDRRAAGERGMLPHVRSGGERLYRPIGQALVVLTHTQVARAAPSMNARPVMTVAAHRPLTGARTVLPALGSATTRRTAWVHVRLPGRPNSSTGWITSSGTVASWTPWRLSVNLDARRVTVYQRGRVVRRFPAVVGAPSTPTPQGRFFIEEGLSLSPQAAGAPFALATSAPI